MWPVSALQEQATWCSTNDLKIKGTKEEENKGDKRRRTSHAFLIVLKKRRQRKRDNRRRNKAAMDAAPSNWHCSRFKEQESILGFRRRIRSENFSGSSSFSSRSLRAKRRRKPACTASFPSYDGASVHILAISSFTETDHRLSYSCRTGRAQGSLGYVQAWRDLSR